MGDNSQKTPAPKSLNRMSEKKILDAYQLLGKALPCSVTKVAGSIVTVKFEVTSPFTLPPVTISMVGLEYIRYPTQVGDKGMVLPADVLLGGINGLGSGVATLTRPANLGALVFVPISSALWSETDDPNATVIYGPNGVIIRDTGKNCSVVVDQENVVVTGKTKVQLVVGDASVTIEDGKVKIVGELIINDKPYLSHQHGGVQSGPPTTYSGGVHNP